MKLLCCFNYNNYFYEIFVNNIGKIYCRKIGKNSNKDNYSDSELIKRIIHKINVMSFALVENIKYKDNYLNVFRNSISDDIYVVSKEKDSYTLCDYNEYKTLYDLYNNSIIYNYDFYNEDFDDDFSSSKFDEDDDFELNDEFIEKKSVKKDKKKKSKIIKLTVCGVVIAAVVFPVSFFVYENIIKPDYLNNTDDVVIDVIEEENEDENLLKILELLKNEEPWVIEQVKEQYYADLDSNKNNNSDSNSSEVVLSKDALKVVESIKNNKYLNDNEKNIIINSFSEYLNLLLKYCNNVDDLCERFSNVTITYDIKDDIEIKNLGAWGEYDTEKNTITVYKDLKEVITHEVSHMFGNFGLGITTCKLTEGYCEMFNPNRNFNQYKKEQLMIIILEQVYGEDFMRSSYFNESLFQNVYDRFDADLYETNKYWNLIRNVNSFLTKYENFSISDINKNEEYKNEMMIIISDLKNMYKELNGKEWEDNEVLNICFDMLTFSSTSKGSKDSLEHHMSLKDIYIDLDGGYSYKIGKVLTPIIDISNPSVDDYLSDENVASADLYVKSFDIKSDGIKIK